MNILTRLLLNALAVAVAAYMLPGVRVETFSALAVLVVVLGIVNTLIKPVLMLLFLPLTILTLGLFWVLINGLIILMLPRFIPGFSVAGYWSALAFSILLSVIGCAFALLGAKK